MDAMNSNLDDPTTGTGTPEPTMAARIAAFDWSETAVGPIGSWPLHLRTAVDILLTAHFPMRVWWGPQLVNIYNDAYAIVLGDKHPGALGQPAATLWGYAWADVFPMVQAVMERGEKVRSKPFHLVMQHKGVSEEIWLTWAYSPIRNADGRIDGMLGIATEDTSEILGARERGRFAQERDATMRALEAERANLVAVVEQAPAFIAVLHGPDHIFQHANEAYYRLVGRRDVIGRSVRQALPELEGQRFFELLDQVYSTGESFTGVESPLIVGPEEKRERRFVNFSYQALRGPDGRPSGIFVHGVDVTEIVSARESLHEREARFRQLANAMPQIVWSAGADGVVNYYNQRWFEYIGADDAVPDFLPWDQHVHPDDASRAAAAWSESVASGVPYNLEFRLRGADDTYRYFLVRALPVVDDQKQVIRWFGTCTDIEDRRRSEAERQEALESEQAARSQAERASLLKDEFLATLSHELRTPLNAILGWAQIIRARPDTSDTSKGIEVIERNARAQASIINDLLDMSAIISGKVRLDVQEVDFIAITHAAIETVRPSADGKGVQLAETFDSLADLQLRGDASRIQQVLWNLLSNAVKFTPAGGQIDVSLVRAEARLAISVTDTGEGILSEFLPYVFDRFRQADSSTTRKHGGLGLGLAIVKQLVELHGGSVHASSAGVGKGATFRVIFPLSPPSLDKAAPASAQEAKIGGAIVPAPESTPSIAGLRILVIDDEADARQLLQLLLEGYGAQVTSTGSVGEAVEWVRNGVCDVVVSDIGMPEEDGYTLIRRIRALVGSPGRNVPAIALTAYARTEDRAKTSAAGFTFYLSKPVEVTELIAMIATAAGRRN